MAEAMEDDDKRYHLSMSPDGSIGMVNRIGQGGQMSSEEVAEMAAKLREKTGQVVIALRHIFEPDHSLPRRPRTEFHSYRDRLLALQPTEDTNIVLQHQPWCDAACKRWNCNCDPEIVTSRPIRPKERPDGVS